MTCDRSRAAIVDGLVGELDDATAIALAQHVADCAACREEEGRLRRILSAPFDAEQLPENLAVRTRLVRELRRGVRSRPRGFLRDAWRLPIPSYAVVALIALALAAGIRIGASWSARARSFPALESAARAGARRPAYVPSVAADSGDAGGSRGAPRDATRTAAPPGVPPGPFVTTPGDALSGDGPPRRGAPSAEPS